MKNRITETVRIAYIFLKNVNWVGLFFLSALWSAGTFHLYIRYLNAGAVENFQILFSPNAISLFHAIVYELSFGLPVLFTITFLQHPLCKEFYYTRIRKRSSVAWAKILTVTGIGGASVCTMVIASSVLYFWNCGIFPGLLPVCREIAMLLVPRIGLALFFVLSEQLHWNLILEFTVLTGIIVGGVLLPAGRAFLQSEWTWIGAFGLTVISFSLVLYVDAKRDISMVEGHEKNDG